MSGNAVPAMLLIDLEPDDNHPGRATPGDVGCGAAFDVVAALRPRLGRRAVFHWFVRADPQIAAFYGDAGDLARRWRQRLDEAESLGDVIGWHPHMLRWDENHGDWAEDFADDAWTAHALSLGAAGFSGSLGRRPTVSRLGAGWMSPHAHARLGELGVELDLSVEPGVTWAGSVHGHSKQRGYDGHVPYEARQPADARKRAASGNRRPRLAPLSTVRLRPALFHALAARRIGLAREGAIPIHAPLPPDIFRAAVRARVRDIAAGGAPNWLTIAVRCDGFVPPRSRRNIERNLTWLARHKGPRFDFVLAPDVLPALLAPSEPA